GRLLGRFRFVLALAWYLPQASQVLCMHALLLRPLGWLRSLRRRQQSLHCWIHGIEVWGAALKPVAGALHDCSGLIASSSFTRDQLLAAAGSWPSIQVVHPMADLIDARQPVQALPQSMRLLTVARMDAGERYKGHRLVLQALRQLKESQTLPETLQWRVVGEGNDRRAIEQQCKDWGLMPWVRFLGGISDSELEQELRSCSLLLMPSAFALEADGRACGEGFGIVYLEAAQAGRASVGCTQGGQSDLIVDGSTGWLIEPDSSDSSS
ncbi:MAG: glycosyltransferase, partial [Synechococcaceae bacterium WB9_4xB_025]|nr:glycosyltransferase [Synechococcaceae bacterium WB9_4xB_025]